ncbi:MAG: PEP-CTERM sorting domain-containing protein [Tepidisphaeraceae bacterium]
MVVVRRIVTLSAGLACAAWVSPAHAVLIYHAGTGGGSPTATRTTLSSDSAAGTYSGATIGDWVGHDGDFSATPIGPHAFLTAGHFSTGGPITLGGQSYTVQSVLADPNTPNSDLRVVMVNQQIPTASIAPLYTGTDELTNNSALIFGRGVPAGASITTGATFNGWAVLGDSNLDRQLSYGLDTVDFAVPSGGSNFLGWFFTPTEGSTSLTNGDSGGPLFLKKNGQWLLAGINFGISSPYSTDGTDSTSFNATIVNATGLFFKDGSTYTPATGPGYSVATRISSQSAWLAQYVPEPASLSLLSLAALLGLRRR